MKTCSERKVVKRVTFSIFAGGGVVIIFFRNLVDSAIYIFLCIKPGNIL